MLELKLNFAKFAPAALRTFNRTMLELKSVLEGKITADLSLLKAYTKVNV